MGAELRNAGGENQENIHSPVAEVVVAVEATEAELEDVVPAPETVPAEALEAMVVSPALATVLPPATVAPAEAGQLRRFQRQH